MASEGLALERFRRIALTRMLAEVQETLPRF